MRIIHWVQNHGMLKFHSNVTRCLSISCIFHAKSGIDMVSVNCSTLSLVYAFILIPFAVNNIFEKKKQKKNVYIIAFITSTDSNVYS